MSGIGMTAAINILDIYGWVNNAGYARDFIANALRDALPETHQYWDQILNWLDVCADPDELSPPVLTLVSEPKDFSDLTVDS